MGRKFPNLRARTIPPTYLAGLFLLIIVLFSATAFYHYESRKAELEHLMHEESSILVQALSNSTETALLGYNELQHLIADGTDTVRLHELRRELGPGRLIQRIGASDAGIVYVIWQDSTAIISATPNVTDAETIQSDPLLAAAMGKANPTTRFTHFDGKRVYEVINPFLFQGERVGILRIGLNADHLETALQRLQTRLLMLLGLAGTGSLAVFSLMVSRQNERKLNTAWRNEQQFSSAILSSMPDAVISLDDKRKITLINAAAENLFHISCHEVTGKPVSELLPECATTPDMPAGGQNAMQETTEISCSIGNRPTVLSIRHSLINNENGSEKGTVMVLRDITEQHALQQAMERREKLTAMGELASGVAHEIRNPLNAIGVIGQRLDMEFSPTNEVEEYHHLAGAIVSEVRRIDAIIERFLKFARPPRMILQATAVDAWLAGCRLLLEAEAKAKSLSLEMDARSMAIAAIDQNQMRQALLNLVRNAVEACDSGGRVRVASLKKENSVLITITDTGKGIPEEMRQQIFNLYFTTKQEGTGMGLSITNQIIQAHNGRISVVSQPGQGCTFTIELPLS